MCFRSWQWREREVPALDFLRIVTKTKLASLPFMTGEPFALHYARQLIHRILPVGKVGFSTHALQEMAKDHLTTIDCTNVLRGGVVEPPELRAGTWRYRVRAASIYVVIAFRSDTHLVVVTAWRIR